MANGWRRLSVLRRPPFLAAMQDGAPVAVHAAAVDGACEGTSSGQITLPHIKGVVAVVTLLARSSR